MFGTRISSRMLLIPGLLAVATGVVIAVWPSSKIDVAPVVRTRPAKPVEAPAPAFSLAEELHGYGKSPVSIDEFRLLAAECERPNDTEQLAIRKRIAKWIDRRYANETQDPNGELELSFGCDDANGLVVDADADRMTKTGHHGRWWILRVTASDIAVIAERTSTAKQDWMEWANEGTVDTLALVDLDGDGIRDVVWSNTEHEGGSVMSSYRLAAWRSTTKTSTQFAAIDGIVNPLIVDDKLVLRLGERDATFTRCVTSALALEPCPAIDIALKYSTITDDELPDRETLAEELAILGASDATKQRLLRAASPPTDEESAQRFLRRAIASLQTTDDLALITPGLHEEPQRHFASVRAEIGDAPCAPSAVTVEERRIAIALVPKASDITRACGSLVWAAWDDRDGMRRETLVDTAKSTKLLAYEIQSMDMAPATAHTDAFVVRDGVVVGLVIHEGTELVAIVDGAIVETRKGAFGPYNFDTRYPDASDDLVVDLATNRPLIASSAGIEIANVASVHENMARRMALQIFDNALWMLGGGSL